MHRTSGRGRRGWLAYIACRVDRVPEDSVPHMATAHGAVSPQPMRVRMGTWQRGTKGLLNGDGSEPEPPTGQVSTPQPQQLRAI